MLRLLVDDVEIELYSNVPVNLKKQFTDVTQINASTSSYSQTFRIPLTRQNQAVFGPSSDPTVVLTYSTKQKRPAVLMDDTLPLLYGFIQIKSWYLSDGQNGEVEVVFFGEVSDLSKKIGDGKLWDLTLTGLNTTMTPTTILSGWTTDADVKFGVVDRGQNWGGSGTFQTASEILAYEMSGYVRISRILTQIFEEAGLSYESTWLDNQEDLNLLAVRGGLTNQYVDVLGSAGFFVGLASAVTHTVTTGAYNAIPFVDTGAFFDAGSNYASSTYTAPTTGNYRFRVKANFQSKATGVTYVRLFINNNLIDTLLSVSDTSPGSFYVGNSLFWTMNAGDTAQIKTIVVGSGTSTLVGTGTQDSPTTSWDLIGFQGIGAVWDCAANMPDMKQIDFVYGLQRSFNLVFVPDQYEPNHFHIEPFSEYVSGGSTVDWSNKIDRTKDWAIRPTSDLQKRQYEWNMGTGEDSLSQSILRQLDRTYGRWRITDPENDFATGTQEILSPFVSLMPQNVPSTDYVVPVLVTPEREPMSRPKPRLAYWNGLESIPWYLGNQYLTSFPRFSDLSQYGTSVTPTTLDLNFGYERKFVDVIANPRDTLYYKYWHPFTASLYGNDARIMEATFQLDLADILGLDWSDRIWVNNDYWRVLSLDYDANMARPLCRATLLRIVASPPLCNYVPYSFAKTGQVTYLSPTGTPITTVPQDCCELFGHVYDTDTATCWGSPRIA